MNQEADPEKRAEEMRLIYKHLTEEIRFVKLQQWRKTNYTLLVVAGIIASAKLLTPLPPPGRIILIVLTVVAGLAGIGVLIFSQWDLTHYRTRVLTPLSTFEEDVKAAVGPVPPNARAHFREKSAIFWLLLAIQAVATAVAVWILTRVPAS